MCTHSLTCTPNRDKRMFLSLSLKLLELLSRLHLWQQLNLHPKLSNMFTSHHIVISRLKKKLLLLGSWHIDARCCCKVVLVVATSYVISSLTKPTHQNLFHFWCPLIQRKLNQWQKRRDDYCELFYTCTPPHDHQGVGFFSPSVHYKWKPYPSVSRHHSRMCMWCVNGKLTFGSCVRECGRECSLTNIYFWTCNDLKIN